VHPFSPAGAVSGGPDLAPERVVPEDVLSGWPCRFSLNSPPPLNDSAANDSGAT